LTKCYDVAQYIDESESETNVGAAEADAKASLHEERQAGLRSSTANEPTIGGTMTTAGGKAPALFIMTAVMTAEQRLTRKIIADTFGVLNEIEGFEEFFARLPEEQRIGIFNGLREKITPTLEEALDRAAG
jgi:hypothetical protein